MQEPTRALSYARALVIEAPPSPLAVRPARHSSASPNAVVATNDYWNRSAPCTPTPQASTAHAAAAAAAAREYAGGEGVPPQPATSAAPAAPPPPPPSSYRTEHLAASSAKAAMLSTTAEGTEGGMERAPDLEQGPPAVPQQRPHRSSGKLQSHHIRGSSGGSGSGTTSPASSQLGTSSSGDLGFGGLSMSLSQPYRDALLPPREAGGGLALVSSRQLSTGHPISGGGGGGGNSMLAHILTKNATAAAIVSTSPDMSPRPHLQGRQRRRHREPRLSVVSLASSGGYAGSSSRGSSPRASMVTPTPHTSTPETYTLSPKL